MDIKKILAPILLAASCNQLQALTSTMNHRLVTSTPLIYEQTNYVNHRLNIDLEPIVIQSFDPDRIMANLSLNGRPSFVLSQQGNGNINPAWLSLGSKNMNEIYGSVVELEPVQQIYGGLFHCYKEFEHFFFDLRTSLIACKSQMNLTETGGINGGGIKTADGQIIYNAQQAFTQNDYLYGKIGNPEKIIGFDNIQVLLGAAGMVDTMQSSNFQTTVAGFALVEVPTGAGTTAEWLFEPQVGTNHWGLGFGLDLLFEFNRGYSFVFGGNFRHLIANWETRTFDLTENGAWSRYLLIESQESLNMQLNVGTPAVNFFTQQALIAGRNQINLYARLERQFEKCLFELSYNLFYDEAERVQQVSGMAPGYGIYNLATSGGVNTASTATINQSASQVQGDMSGTGFVELVTSDFNLSSGAAGQWMSNAIAARVQKISEFYKYGVGGSIDLGRGSQALSSWAVWFNFELMLP